MNAMLVSAEILSTEELFELEQLLALRTAPVEANWHNDAVASAYLHGKRKHCAPVSHLTPTCPRRATMQNASVFEVNYRTRPIGSTSPWGEPLKQRVAALTTEDAHTIVGTSVDSSTEIEFLGTNPSLSGVAIRDSIPAAPPIVNPVLAQIDDLVAKYEGQGNSDFAVGLRDLKDELNGNAAASGALDEDGADELPADGQPIGEFDKTFLPTDTVTVNQAEIPASSVAVGDTFSDGFQVAAITSYASDGELVFRVTPPAAQQQAAQQ